MAFSLANVDHAYGQGYGNPIFIGASDGPWEINVIPNRGPQFPQQQGGSITNGGLHTWQGFQGAPARPDGAVGTSGLIVPEQIFAQWFFFRDNVDFSSGERLLETLGFDGAVSSPSDKINLNYGELLSAPYRVNLTYDLNGTSQTQSSITLQLSITNASSQTRDLNFFMYSALQLDGATPGRAQDVLQRTGNTSFRYQSAAGSRVDVNAIGNRIPAGGGNGSAQNPDRFEITPFAGLLQKLSDGAPTQLSNTSVVAGPGQIEHAFQWNILSFAPGEKIVFDITMNGTFRALAMPTSGGGGQFFFSDNSPPVFQQAPRFYDPDPATGFTYEITDGGNFFAEIYLPAAYTDGQYTLEILDPSHPQFGMLLPLVGDGMSLSYDFVTTDADGMGVQSFRITGIEAEANVDPDNPFGFPTGLTFRTNAPANFSMTAIPEPSAVLLLALAGVLWAARRRRG